MDSNDNEPEVFEIRVKGHLHRRRAAQFEGLTITLEDDGSTLLRGPLPDQTALHSILLRIRNMNLKLISIRLVSGAPGPSPATTSEGQLSKYTEMTNPDEDDR